jgi:hypothetical protein
MTMEFTTEFEPHIDAVLRLARMASRTYDRFVFDTPEQAARANRTLFEHQAADFSPPRGVIAIEYGRVLGMIAGMSAEAMFELGLRACAVLARLDYCGPSSAAFGRIRMAAKAAAPAGPGDFYSTKIVVARRARATGLADELARRQIEETRGHGFSRIVYNVNPEHRAGIDLQKRMGCRHFGRATAEDPDTGRSMTYCHGELVL